MLKSTLDSRYYLLNTIYRDIEFRISTLLLIGAACSGYGHNSKSAIIKLKGSVDFGS